MLTLRPGSQAHRLVTILSVVGEYPLRSLRLLGNERVLRDLIRRLTKIQTVRNPETEERLETKVLQLSGKGGNKSVRLYKGALPILDWIHGDAFRYYMTSFWNHRFPGDMAHRDRNHRVAEAVALGASAKIEVLPYCLPKLQRDSICQVVPDGRSLYLARDIKRIHPTEQSKTMFTRMVGALFYPGGCYAVYNTRQHAMKWNGMGEFKALHSLLETARLNAGISRIDSALLLGESGEIAFDTLRSAQQSHRPEFRFDGIYRHVHFIPLHSTGIRLLRMLTLPDWKDTLLNLLFAPETRSYGKAILEYDACVDGTYVFSFLDGDLARLIRFCEAAEIRSGRLAVLCFPDQVPFLRPYLAPHIMIRTIDPLLVERELCLGWGYEYE